MTEGAPPLTPRRGQPIFTLKQTQTGALDIEFSRPAVLHQKCELKLPNKNITKIVCVYFETKANKQDYKPSPRDRTRSVSEKWSGKGSLFVSGTILTPSTTPVAKRAVPNTNCSGFHTLLNSTTCGPNASPHVPAIFNNDTTALRVTVGNTSVVT